MLVLKIYKYIYLYVTYIIDFQYCQWISEHSHNFRFVSFYNESIDIKYFNNFYSFIQAINESENHSQVDEQHSYEESSQEYLDELYDEQPLNDEDEDCQSLETEDIAQQQDFWDYEMTASDLARIDEFDRQKVFDST